ncbi:non-ribosomal peptide synthetase [Phytohabitans suffuscus]|uniref:Carrier domain-containing protein n=1 Tax=Phytohabitans suffuscus TaxID=624315 RepID=A0A6F8Y9R1_9ACTN|nr:non-ribosomal peptide synthetase [Phytohabitans suffuscus]BCB82763.1 hypothetical protein Psuf_000760 [Phytohabitans suffuscus]
MTGVVSRGLSVVDRDADVSTPTRVARWAREQPEVAALSGRGEVLTYAQLYERAGRLATVLRAHGIGRGELVALSLERSPDLVVAALAVLFTGAGYVGVDVDEPDLRLSAILADSGASVVLSRAATRERFVGGAAQVLSIEDALARSVPATEPAEPDPTDVCYVTYTSGSTGTPKGVLVPHRGVANLVSWYRQAFGARPGDRITQLARPSFDAWALEVWPCLANGATLCLAEKSVPDSPAAFAGWLAAEGVTISFLTTALAVEMLDEPWQAPDLALRVMLLGGEKLHRPPRAQLPFRLYNLYGPTEASVVATCGEVPAGAPRDLPPPIGWALPNTRAHVLDERREPVPPGTVGELYVGGTGVALGYLNRPELTDTRFVPDPFAGGDARMYATGDLVRQRPDGALDFIGRVDGQVKLRGFRIELGEVESALNQLAGISEAVVVKHDQDSRLAAYLVPADPADPPDQRRLRQDLALRLPDYMIPQTIELLDALPLTPHGKVDRAALARRPLPGTGNGTGTGGDTAAPTYRTDTERVLAQIWCEVLGITAVDREDSFFDLGGDSLQAMRMATRARGHGIQMGAEDVFENEVLHELAASVSAAAGA